MDSSCLGSGLVYLLIRKSIYAKRFCIGGRGCDAIIYEYLSYSRVSFQVV